MDCTMSRNSPVIHSQLIRYKRGHSPFLTLSPCPIARSSEISKKKKKILIFHSIFLKALGVPHLTAHIRHMWSKLNFPHLVGNTNLVGKPFFCFLKQTTKIKTQFNLQ